MSGRCSNDEIAREWILDVTRKILKKTTIAGNRKEQSSRSSSARLPLFRIVFAASAHAPGQHITASK